MEAPTTSTSDGGPAAPLATAPPEARRQGFFTSIRLKIALVMGITLALSLAAICALLIWEDSQQSQRLLGDDMEVAGRLFVTRLEGMEERAANAARSAAALPSLGRALAAPGPAEAVAARLLPLVAPLASVHEVADLDVLDARGRVICSLHEPASVGGPAPALPGLDPSRDRDERRGIVVGPGRPTRLTIAASATILARGRRAGAVVATIPLTPDALDAFRDRKPSEAGFELSLMTRARGTMAPPLRAVTTLVGDDGSRLAGTAVPQALAAGSSLERLDDPPLLARYRRIPALSPGFDLTLEVAAPPRYLADVRAGTWKTILLAALLALIVGTASSLVVARRITGPLTALQRAAEHMRMGNYPTEPVVVKLQDEVGYLARTFNEMAAALQERDGRLQTFSRNLFQGQKALEYVNDRLKREKNEIDSILKSIPEGVLVLDPQGHVINTNPEASVLLKRRRADLLGQVPSEVLRFVDGSGKAHPDLDTALLSQQAPLPGETSAPLEGFLVAGEEGREASQLPVEIDSVPIQDDKKQIVGQVVIIRDVTRKFEIDRLKEEFLAVITHQLKSPISALIGYSQILKESEGLSQENRDIVENMKSLGEFLNLQIGNILASARLEANRMTYRLEHFPVATSFQDLERLFYPVARTRGIHLVIEAPGDAFMHADIEKVHDILSNLVNNALKFTPAGGTIRVSCDADDAFVHVKVGDTGKGIPADAVPRLFQKFYQVTGEGHGTGLGLFIARTMVENMGGRIEVASVVREGTTFTVTLPRGRAAEARRAPPSAPTLAATVLVADADRDINAFVRLYLERQGVQHVRQAFTAGDARTLIERDPPDALVLGEDLGDRTGLALAMDLHAQEKTQALPIVYVTATVKPDQDGIFAAQLARPLEPAALIERLRAILQHHLQGSDGKPGTVAARSEERVG